MPPHDAPLGSTPVTLHVPHVAGIDPSAMIQGFQMAQPLLNALAAHDCLQAGKSGLMLGLWAVNTFGPKPAPAPGPANPPAPPQP